MKKAKTWTPAPDHVHLYFELTYASYLVWPRSIMQSMPESWQKRFVELAREIEEAVDAAKLPPTPSYRVQALDGSRFTRDHYANYDRGRRNVFEERRKP